MLQAALAPRAPGTRVGVELCGATVWTEADEAGLIDVRLPSHLTPGRHEARLRVGGRLEVPATVHAVASRPTLGVVWDIDGTAWVTGLRPALRALARNAYRTRRGRRPVHGVATLVRGLLEDEPGAPVLYVSAGPQGLAGAVTRFMERNGFPPGPVLMTVRDSGEGKERRTGAEWKRFAVERAIHDLPHVRWVLVGDVAPQVLTGIAREHPGHVAAVVLRSARPGAGGAQPSIEWLGQLPVIRGPNAAGLLPRLRAALGLGSAGGSAAADHDWFLTHDERGNPATRLRAWTEGNAVRPLVHGRPYLAALAEQLARTGVGDAVLFSGWRGDADELLTDSGPTIGTALSAAAHRGAAVKGLLWRSHLEAAGYTFRQNRGLVEAVHRAGAEVLLDHRVRPAGSQHQKFLLVRHGADAAADVAFVGGIDLGHGRRDDATHHGDEQRAALPQAYGPTPAWHDVQLELRGPAVRDVEDTFLERWEDPAALSRLPWHVVPEVLARLRRTPSVLPPATPDPPGTGTCAVQLLRTYPKRRPGYPYAPDGERSIARAYVKALTRARALVYVEDQYLWSHEVAGVFAAALRRVPRLQVIAVVPRHPDRDSPLTTPPVAVGQARAIRTLMDAGGDRVQVLDLERPGEVPVYVHSKVCVVDDVWASVGSGNLNRRSWTHDSEITAAVLDDERDLRAPTDPGGLGDGARRFARELRLQLMREHLERRDGDDADLLDPADAAAAVRRSAAALDAWHREGRGGERPLGRLRQHEPRPVRAWQRWFAVPAYRLVADPDGRSPRMRRTL